MAFVVLAQVSLESLPNGSRTEDQEVVIRRHAVCHLSDESVQVLEPTRFAGGLGRTSAAVPDAGLVADVAGRPAVGRHIRYEVLDIRGVVLPADDDRYA